MAAENLRRSGASPIYHRDRYQALELAAAELVDAIAEWQARGHILPAALSSELRRLKEALNA